MCEDLPYYHKVDKAASEALVTANGSDGTFLIRPKGADPSSGYILSVVYKGKPTHHALALVDGEPTLNKKTYGGHESFGALISALGTKTKGWPVPLTSPVKREDSGDGSGDGDGGGGSTAPAAGKAASLLPYFHDIAKADAEGLIGGQPDGTFLLRPAKGEDEFTLSVVYKKKPTHHAIKAPAGGNATLNKKEYGGHAVVGDLLAALGKKTKGWPVLLTTPIMGPNNETSAAGSGGDTAPEPQEAAPEAAAAPVPAPEAAAPSAPAAAPAREPEPEPEPEKEAEKPVEPPQPKVVPQWKLDKAARKRADAIAATKGDAGEVNEGPVPVEESKVWTGAPVDFAKERNRKKADEEDAAAERKAAREAHAAAIRDQALSAKAKKAPLPEPGKSPPKAALVARAFIEKEKEAAKQEEESKIKAAKEAKAEKKRKEKEEATAAAEVEQKAVEEAAYLDSLPAWKRDKLLRQRAADTAEAKRVEEDRSARLQKMRDDKANKLVQMEQDRIQRAKDAEIAAKRAKREQEEAVEQSIKEVAEKQKSFRRNLGGDL